MSAENEADDQALPDADFSAATEHLNAGLDILKAATLDDQGCIQHPEIVTALHGLAGEMGRILECAEINHSYLSDMPTTREGRADHNGYSAELRTATSTAWRLMGQLARMRDRLRKPPLDPKAPGGR